MKAIILGVGQGRRFLPLSEHRPRCLMPVAGRPLLEWQLASLAAAGIEETVVVTGFGARQVMAAAEAAPHGGMKVSTVHNPFYGHPGDISAAWAARDAIAGDVLLVNGDTLFDAAVVRRAALQPSAPITVVIDRRESYGADVVKVQLRDGRPVALSRSLPAHLAEGEAVGLLRLTAAGSRLFAQAVQRAMHDGLKRTRLSVIDGLAHTPGLVAAVSVEGLAWEADAAPVDHGRDVRIPAAWMRPAELGRIAEAG